MTVVPVFLLSLPRSGSTFTQRVLTAHPGVTTTAEPWLLLPLLAPLDARFPLQSAWERTVGEAVRDFVDQLPQGRGDYEAAVRGLTLDLYGQAAGDGAQFFIDKTPPYHHVAEELVRLFPNGRFVVLWRNPLAMLASIVDTLADGRWEVYRYRGDLFHGVENLVRLVERHPDRVHAVRYEDLVTGEAAWRDLGRYLGLPFQADALSRFAGVQLEGRMGDRTGARRYATVSTEPLTKWRITLASPLRKAWARRYLLWIGRSRLATMGYDLDGLLAELDAVETHRDRLPGDLAETAAALVRELAKARTGDRRMVSSFRALLGRQR